MKQRSNFTEKNNRVFRERDPIPWRYCLLTLVCGLLLVVGFFWAARQHFSAMDFGIKNAKLREQKKTLEDEQRHLFLTKEISLSPAEIKKMAKKIGLQDLTAVNVATINTEITNEKDSTSKTNTQKDKKQDEKIKTSAEVKKKEGVEAQANSRPQIAKK